MGDEEELPQAGTYAFVVRYEDEFDGENNFFDHMLTLRVKPNWKQDAEEVAPDESKCFQNVYPYSFGGCPGDTNCGMTVYDTIYDSESTSRMIYIGGAAAKENLFLESQLQTGEVGFIMVVNSVGMP